MGLYFDCIDLENARYAIMIIQERKSSFRLGVCYPKECSPTLLNASPDKQFNAHGQIYKHKFIDEEESKANKVSKYNLLWLIGLVAFYLILYIVNYTYQSDDKEVQMDDFPRHIGANFSGKRKANKWRKKTMVSDYTSSDQSYFSTFVAQFNLTHNFKRIIKTEIKEFKIIYAIRVISLLMIFFSMSFYIFYRICMQNASNLPEIIESAGFLVYSQWPIAIDLFLFTNGFIMYFKLHSFLMEENPRLRVFSTFISFKFFTQLPILVIMTVTILCLPFAGSGPMFINLHMYRNTFIRSAWLNFLYGQNFFQLSFMDHFWIYAVEMQIYCFYVLTVCFFMQQPKLKWTIIVCTFVGSLVTLFCIDYIKDYRFFYNYNEDKNLFQFEDVGYVFSNYLWTFTRCWPYLLGVMVAKVYSMKPKLVRNLFLTSRTSIAASSDIESIDTVNEEWSFIDLLAESKMLGVFFLILGLILMTYPMINQLFLINTVLTFVNAFSLTFDSLVFLIGMSFSLLVISVDYFSSLRNLFDNKIFYILGNSNYSLYLMTPTLFVFYFTSQPNSIFFAQGDFFVRTLGVILLGVILSVTLTIVVHMPFKLFFSKVLFRGMKRMG